jgi:sugar phosphate isomerase/epimerase
VHTLAKFISDRGLKVENAISFTSWMVGDPAKRKEGWKQLEEEMSIMAALGCPYIAAPPAGVERGRPIDLQETGHYYREILQIGRKNGVMPLLEFWGASGTLYNLGQALAIAAAADDPDAKILPDVYHLFRGGSGFNGLKLLSGDAVEVIHINDYPADKPVNEQTDSDRVYPGDGAAPLKQVLQYLLAMGGTKVLSLELFNKTYWAQNPLTVAKTGLHKMKILVDTVL